MSRYSGRHFKGASRYRRDDARQEAEERNARAGARLRVCGHVHGSAQGCEDALAVDLLRRVFGAAS